jgi:hypothetical protein
MNDIAKEIELMTKSLNSDAETVQTDPPSTEAPGTDAPTTDAPPDSTDAPSTDSPSTDAPTTDAPQESDEEKRLREENEELRRKIAERDQPKTESPSTEAPTTTAPVDEIDFMDGVDFENVRDNPKEFNRLLNNVLKKGVEIGERRSRSYDENVLKSLPSIVKTNIATVRSLEKASEEFYENNSDLKPFKKVVALTFEEIAAKNPDKTFTDILKDVEKEARKKLDLHIKANKPKPEDDTPPRLPRNKGGKRQKPKPNTNSFEAELEAMDKALNL